MLEVQTSAILNGSSYLIEYYGLKEILNVVTAI
jgi:hypothetical protein